MAGSRAAEVRGPPWFLVSVDSKRVSNLVSLLESTLRKARVSVVFKRVRRIPMSLREMISGGGSEGFWRACGKGWREQR